MSWQSVRRQMVEVTPVPVLTATLETETFAMDHYLMSWR